MADDNRSGEQVRQHIRKMLLRLAALQRKRAEKRDAREDLVNAAVEAEREDHLSGTISDSQRPA
jgi:hypothetical protein